MNKFDYVCKMIFIHIDNSRDIHYKVTNIQFYAGQCLGDTELIKSYDITSKMGSWVSANIPDDGYIHFRIELKGAETLRVRQVKLLGLPTIYEALSSQKSNIKLGNAYQIQHRNCEAETLRVFRLLTAQVFGKLILGKDQDQTTNEDTVSNVPRSIETLSTGGLESNATSMLADSLDLREHMVGILFSRSKLSHLQKQVIVHIVYAIRKETLRAKDEWEALNSASNMPTAVIEIPHDQKSETLSENSRTPDVYCFEMLSMVLALSGSTVGRSYLSNQHGLLKDLLTLLHTGSDRVQRQVTALLRRILPEILPDQVADLLGVQQMPATDFSIINQDSEDFDMNRLGMLDIFLAVIAKSLQLQVKIKSTTATNKQPTILRLCSCIDFKIAELKEQNSDGNRPSTSKAVDSVSRDESQSFECQHSDDKSAGDEDDSTDGVRTRPEGTTKNLNQRWFLKGTIHVKQAENIIGLIRDMGSVSGLTHQ